MNPTECYFNGELSPEMKKSFYQSLQQDGKELLNVISTIGLMKKAADFQLDDLPPELEPPVPGNSSLADNLLKLTLKALTECQEPSLSCSSQDIEIPEPLPQQDLSSTLVKLIARLDAGVPVLPSPAEPASFPSGRI